MDRNIYSGLFNYPDQEIRIIRIILVHFARKLIGLNLINKNWKAEILSSDFAVVLINIISAFHSGT